MTTFAPPVDILGVPIDPVTYAQTLDLMAEWIGQRGPHQIATVNPEFVMTAQSHHEFRAALRAADLRVADGVGLLWAARRLGRNLPERVTGSDLVPLLAARAAVQEWRLFLLGAAPGVAEKTARRLQAAAPGVQIVGVHAGSPHPHEAAQIVAHVRTAAPDVLLVAYGAPAQDLWIA